MGQAPTFPPWPHLPWPSPGLREEPWAHSHPCHQLAQGVTGQHWSQVCIPLLQVTVLSLLQDVDTAFLVKADLETNLEALEHETEFLKALFEEVLKATRSSLWPVRPAPWGQGGQEEPRLALDTCHRRPGSETPQDLLSRSLAGCWVSSREILGHHRDKDKEQTEDCGPGRAGTSPRRPQQAPLLTAPSLLTHPCMASAGDQPAAVSDL